MLWSAGEWRRRWRLFAGFGVTITLLVGAGEVLLPGWLRVIEGPFDSRLSDFFAGMAAYRKYFPTTSLPRLLLGDTVGIFVSVVIVVWLSVFGWNRRKISGESKMFAWVFAAFLMGTVLAFPLFTPFNQALLILPAVLMVREWAAIPQLGRIVFIGFVSWPWIASIAILLLRLPLNPASPIPNTMERYKMHGTPSLVLIDRHGLVRKHTFGAVDDLRIGAEIGALVQESAAAALSRSSAA